MKNLKRQAKIQDFISQYGFCKNDKITALTADASSRKYYRITSAQGKTAVLMDDEGCKCHTHEFVELSDFLRPQGVFVPKVLAKDFTNGLLLLEDLGDKSVHSLLTPDNELELYLKSAEVLAKVIKVTKRPDCVDELSRRFIETDVQLFTEWYIPMTLGHPLSELAKKEFLNIFNRLSELAYRVPNRLVLWDYHIDNIMLPPQSKDCAIIDFQDAKWGPLTYDIVSLLAADRRQTTDKVINQVKDFFFNRLENVLRTDFDDSFAFLSMFRHMRVLGRFTTLSMVNQKEQYLHYIPQTWKMLEQALLYPKLEEMKQWVDKYIPQEKRIVPKRKPIHQAMILAAGRGSRMRELTTDTPKPLIQVADKALIDYNFKHLSEINIKDVVVNLCYKKEQVRDHLDKNHSDFKITYSVEEEMLETGGGVKKALPYLKEDAFFVLNSDVFYIDRGYKPALWQMMDAWDPQKYDILLLLQDLKHICGDRGIGDYRTDENSKPVRNEQKVAGFPYMFAGISIVNRKIFDEEKREKFSLRDMFDIAQSQGRLGFVINQADYFHVGTPEAVKAAEIKINEILKNLNKKNNFQEIKFPEKK